MPEDFLEELIVRRELAFKFCRFTPDVESFEALPDWCRKTMAKHAADPALRYTRRISSKKPKRMTNFGTPARKNF